MNANTKNATIDEQAHQMSRARYQALRGIHRPHIAEIHPGVQYAHLSGRARNAYDEKRRAEWDASAACYQDWIAALTTTFDAGKSYKDPDVDPEAKSAYLGVLVCAACLIPLEA